VFKIKKKNKLQATSNKQQARKQQATSGPGPGDIT
tara:strand:+ start:269 stop:373 length:105 start_codon:yes stop_codon:yes gene_type:complete